MKVYGLADYKSSGRKKDVFRHNSLDVRTQPNGSFEHAHNDSYENIGIFNSRKNKSLAYQKSEKIRQALYD